MPFGNGQTRWDLDADHYALGNAEVESAAVAGLRKRSRNSYIMGEIEFPWKMNGPEMQTAFDIALSLCSSSSCVTISGRQAYL